MQGAELHGVPGRLGEPVMVTCMACLGAPYELPEGHTTVVINGMGHNAVTRRTYSERIRVIPACMLDKDGSLLRAENHYRSCVDCGSLYQENAILLHHDLIHAARIDAIAEGKEWRVKCQT